MTFNVLFERWKRGEFLITDVALKVFLQQFLQYLRVPFRNRPFLPQLLFHVFEIAEKPRRERVPMFLVLQASRIKVLRDEMGVHRYHGWRSVEAKAKAQMGILFRQFLLQVQTSRFDVPYDFRVFLIRQDVQRS